MADEVRVATQVTSERVDGREVFIFIKTEYPAGSDTPGRTYVVGPQGQITDTYEEMLELLGIEPRARPEFAESNGESLDDPRPFAEMSEEELLKEIEEMDREIDEFRKSGAVDYAIDRTEPMAPRSPVTQPAAESAGSATVNVDPAELERGFAERFPPLPPTKLKYRELDRKGLPPEQWVKSERGRRAFIFEEEHGGHPLARDRRTEDELTPAESNMQMVRAAESIKFVYPERYEAALDAEKYKTFFQRFPEEAVMRDGIKGARCRFIRADGTKCGSPALKGGRMCYFHSRAEGTHKPKRKSKTAVEGVRAPALELPVLEDDLAIQMAVTGVCRQLASEPLDTKRASLLLYGLQVASVAVRKTRQKGVITKK